MRLAGRRNGESPLRRGTEPLSCFRFATCTEGWHGVFKVAKAPRRVCAQMRSQKDLDGPKWGATLPKLARSRTGQQLADQLATTTMSLRRCIRKWSCSSAMPLFANFLLRGFAGLHHTSSISVSAVLSSSLGFNIIRLNIIRCRR